MKKLVVGLMGFGLLFIGVLMVVLPGPALILIPAGLAVLATEFNWAKKILNYLKYKIGRAKKAA